MGSFEKLGILVIVVIIVMILAVAIHQWGGAGAEAEGLGALRAGAVPAATIAPPLEVDFPPSEAGGGGDDGRTSPAPPEDASTWPGGIPRRYKVAKDDMIWNLVTKTWKLKESFVHAIEVANPSVDSRRLRAGDTLVIPDPSSYLRDSASKRGAAAKTTPKGRIYEVKVGDTLDSIAKEQMGDSRVWEKILEANPGLKPRALQPGKEIVIPVK